MSSAEIFKEFGFEAAHQLRNLPAEHKCARLHGHSFRVELHVRGEIEPETGWVMDFADISAAWEPVGAQLDHRFLNDLPGLETSPTSENLAIWIWDRVSPGLPLLSKVVVRETCTSGCTYTGA